MAIRLSTEICADIAMALQREWLVTNGIGGFACGTVAGALTRRYHGLLMAALRPPLGRTLLVAKIDETATAGGRTFNLYTNVWKNGVEQPAGCGLLESFELLLGVPSWRYAFGGAGLTKRVWMEDGENTTYVRYELAPTSPGVALSLKLLVNYRDYHALTRAGDWRMTLEPRRDGLRVCAHDRAVPIDLRCTGTVADQARWTMEHVWYRGYTLWAERDRGFDFLEDHLCVGCCHVALQPGQSVTLVLSGGSAMEAGGVRASRPPTVGGEDGLVASALRRRYRGAWEYVRSWQRALARTGSPAAPAAGSWTPAALAQLVIAADQFIAARRARHEAQGCTVIAGYPWLGDWGRDTMIALPGLTLVTGRPELARQILRTWATYVDCGMIPNRFPDEGHTPDYNTADAALWYIWAIDQYVRATDDRNTLVELFPSMAEIVHWLRRGTRFNIHVDDDGLVYAGVPGLNLTWMDVKIGDRVITPRLGKPIELSALWYDGLRNLVRLAAMLGKPASEYERLAERARSGFDRFWNAERQCCFDVLDGPEGDDPRVRPNQVFAVSLEHSPLSHEQQRAVVVACERKLLTPFGLRSLAPDEPGYRGRCEGGPVERDEAYHQGTVWGWLLGPFVIAHYNVYRDAQRVRLLLEAMFANLHTHAVGSLSEIFDGKPPYSPRGCFAQAWSVAETLRAWQVTQGGQR